MLPTSPAWTRYHRVSLSCAIVCRGVSTVWKITLPRPFHTRETPTPQLNPFHMFTWKVIIFLLSKSGTKPFGINNRDDSFSTLLTGESVIWPMCNIPTLLDVDVKAEVILWCELPPVAHLKLSKMSGACRGIRWVMVLGKSTHKFPFKEQLSNQLIHVCVCV